MTAPSDRRGFLRGLVSLPLIGGGVTLIGAPTAVATPTSRALLDSYDAWLLYERCKLKAEKIGPAFYWTGMPDEDEAVRVALSYVPVNNGGMGFHFNSPEGRLPPSSRAALVLSAVGVDWRKGGL